MFPHQIMSKIDDALQVYDTLKAEFPSPRQLIDDLKKLRRFISAVEDKYGSVERFVDEVGKKE